MMAKVMLRRWYFVIQAIEWQSNFVAKAAVLPVRWKLYYEA